MNMRGFVGITGVLPFFCMTAVYAGQAKPAQDRPGPASPESMQTVRRSTSANA